MKRDFKGEGLFNIFLRLKRSLTVRVRGSLYSILGVFNSKTKRSITLGSKARIKNGKWILLNDHVAFSDYCRLECYQNKTNEIDFDEKIVVGENTSFGELAHLGAINRITIGKNVLVGSKVLIIDHDHGTGGAELKNQANVPPRERPLVSKGIINIGDNVWIGEGVIILAGADIGDNCIIAANSLVKGRVEPNSVFFNRRW